MAPYTFTFGDIALKVPSAAGVIGKPEAVSDENGCGPCDGGCASSAPTATPVTSAALPTSQVIRFIGSSPRFSFW